MAALGLAWENDLPKRNGQPEHRIDTSKNPSIHQPHAKRDAISGEPCFDAAFSYRPDAVYRRRSVLGIVRGGGGFGSNF